MAPFIFFKSKKDKEKKADKEKKSALEPVKKEKEEKKPVKPKDSKTQAVRKAPKIQKASALTYKVLQGPHITEKATDLTKKDQYIFKVWPRANKNEVRKAIKSLYRVDVESVNIIKIPSKKRRLGRIQGKRKGYKKAIVTVKKGQKIEVLPK